MTPGLKDIASKIVGKDLSTATELQVVAELKVFITKADAADLILDDDVEVLFEIALIYSDLDSSELMTKVSKEVLNIHTPEYIRVGKTLRPDTVAADKRKMKKFATTMCGLHSDLNYQIKKSGVVFLDDTNAVFSFEQWRSLEGLPHEHSGKVILNRVHDQKTLEKLVPKKYLEQKKWEFLTKYKRCEGTYITETELLDLMLNREIITFSRYE